MLVEALLIQLQVSFERLLSSIVAVSVEALLIQLQISYERLLSKSETKK